jgi:hypothetical protein
MDTQLFKKYSCREEEIRETLTPQECVHLMKYKYDEIADLDNANFDIYDQLLACESIAESTPIREYKTQQANTNANGNGMINDTCKQTVCFELTESKQKAITMLELCDYKTPPILLSQYLEEIFKEWESIPGHWLYVAQKYNPRAICRTLNQMIKIQQNGQVTIKNPSAYFTSSIMKFRKQRRSI